MQQHRNEVMNDHRIPIRACFLPASAQLILSGKQIHIFYNMYTLIDINCNLLYNYIHVYIYTDDKSYS